MTTSTRDTGGFELAHTVTAEEAVTATLRAAIRDGALTPGQRLTQSEIAGQLGVSRIPLRDALRRLEVESLVEIDGHRGARVTVLTAADVAEIYEMRIMLEARCMRYAIQNLSAEAAVLLADEATASEHDGLAPREAFQKRREFYGRLYAHAERPRMRRTIMQLRDNVDRYHMLSDRSHAHLAHKELAEAIAERNADRAVAVLTEHISESRDDLLAALASETDV
jgi:DNA-binding GntR family transcriptional regulator